MPVLSSGEQRALVLRRLRQSDTSRYSPTKGASDYEWIDDAIERGIEEFVRLTKCLRTYCIIQLKSSIRSYVLPADFIDIMTAYYYDAALSDGYRELTFTTIEKLNDEISDWRVDTGSPKRIYIDRLHGKGASIGLYPIPESDGAAISFTNAYANEASWICPLYTNYKDFGRILRYAGTSTFVLSTDDNVIVSPEVSNYNLLIEYYRLPYLIAEMPPEAAKAISYYAAAELLQDAPEDSAEYKRSVSLLHLFDQEVATYINRRKRPQSGQNLRLLQSSWNYLENMQFYKDIA